MLRLLKLNKELKLPEVDAFISNNCGPKKFLIYFTDSLSRVKANAYQFDIDLFKEPFPEFAWLFA